MAALTGRILASVAAVCRQRGGCGSSNAVTYVLRKLRMDSQQRELLEK